MPTVMCQSKCIPVCLGLLGTDFMSYQQGSGLLKNREWEPPVDVCQTSLHLPIGLFPFDLLQKNTQKIV